MMIVDFGFWESWGMMNIHKGDGVNGGLLLWIGGKRALSRVGTWEGETPTTDRQ